MPGNIFKLDKQEGIEQAWHGLTEVKPFINLRECWLTQWDVERVPLYVADFDGNESYKEQGFIEAGFDMLRCTDNGHLIGKPIGKSYGEITNAQFLDMIEAAVGGTAHKIVSVFSLRNRGRVGVTLKLDSDTLTRIGKRVFKDYLTAGNSFDQSCELFWMNSSICGVCDNIFSMILSQVRQAVDMDEQDQETGNTRVRHSKNASAKLPAIADVINRAVGVRAEFYAALNDFHKTPCSVKQAENIFAGFEASKDAEALATLTRRRVNDEMYLFTKGRGSEGGKNLLDLFSAGTDLYTHSHTGGDMQRQWESSEYGSGARRKQALFSMLKDEDRRNATAKRGEKLLAACNDQFE
jgi:hypothetical protein